MFYATNMKYITIIVVCALKVIIQNIKSSNRARFFHSSFHSSCLFSDSVFSRKSRTTFITSSSRMTWLSDLIAFTDVVLPSLTSSVGPFGNCSFVGWTLWLRRQQAVLRQETNVCNQWGISLIGSPRYIFMINIWQNKLKPVKPTITVR